MIKQALALISVFILGFVASGMHSQAILEQQDTQAPSDGGFEFRPGTYLATMLASDRPSTELSSPADRITEDQILVSGERVVIDVKGAEWATFTDTNSMDPVIDSGANAIEVAPKTADEVQPGDIVAYESEYAEGTIIHRVIYKGEDDNGTYFIVKGDNNPSPDPGRVRFSQIKRVVVAIIY